MHHYALLLAAAPPASVNATIIVTLAVSAVCGWAIPPVVDVVTHAKAPTALKTVIALFLTAVAGVAPTVAFTPNERWQDYLLAIGVALVNSQSAHRVLQGLGDPIQNSKLGAVGIGAPADDATTVEGDRDHLDVGGGDPGQGDPSYSNANGSVAVVVLLIILALVLFGFGFTVKWLFVLAIIVVLFAIFAGTRS